MGEVQSDYFGFKALGDPQALLDMDNPSAWAVGLSLKRDEYTASAAKKLTELISGFHDHEYELNYIIDEIRKLNDQKVDDDEYLAIPDSLESKIRYYYNEFWPQAQKHLDMTERHDPLHECKNPNYPAFQSFAQNHKNLKEGSLEKENILNIKKGDLEGITLGIEDLRLRLTNKIQGWMLDTELLQKDQEQISLILHWIMTKNPQDTFIKAQLTR